MDEKRKKIIFTVISNVYLCLFLPPLIAFAEGGTTQTIAVRITAITVILINFLSVVIMKKKEVPKIKKPVTAVLCAALVALVLIIPLSDSYTLLRASYIPDVFASRSASVLPQEKIFEEKLDDNTYLLVYRKKDGEKRCTVLKKYFNYFYASELEYSWNETENSKDEDRVLPFKLSVYGKNIDMDSEGYVAVAVLKDGEDKAYADTQEMKILSDGETRFAYCYFKGRAYDDPYMFKARNGETTFGMLV